MDIQHYYIELTVSREPSTGTTFNVLAKTDKQSAILFVARPDTWIGREVVLAHPRFLDKKEGVIWTSVSIQR